ncbi:hypothetical protein ABZX40_38490 [Streptomyces sp. NPDC004610]|uniref:hypothetical protein n=1 Tax=unclassified Streptomyces TaxID=2593676 RepID=UPI0033B4AAC7
MTAPVSADSRVTELERLSRRMLDGKTVQPGGEGKTTMDASARARALAHPDRPRPLLADMDPPRGLSWPEPAPAQPVIVDLP